MPSKCLITSIFNFLDELQVVDSKECRLSSGRLYFVDIFNAPLFWKNIEFNHSFRCLFYSSQNISNDDIVELLESIFKYSLNSCRRTFIEIECLVLFKHGQVFIFFSCSYSLFSIVGMARIVIFSLYMETLENIYCYYLLFLSLFRLLPEKSEKTFGYSCE